MEQNKKENNIKTIIDEFKEFIKSKPELVDYVKNKEYTWQDFYEVFDLYGKDESVWKKYKEKKSDNEGNERKNASITELTDLVKNINIDNVQKYINNAQKAINVISELTSKKTGVSEAQVIAKTPRVINKFFGD